MPWRALWHIVDTDLVDRTLIRSLLAGLRKAKSVTRSLPFREWTTGSVRALRATLIRTDVSRWQRVARETPAWDGRNQLIAAQIPADSTVLDLGSGAQTLRKHLRLGCFYQPCDVVNHSDDVLLCDFNAGVYPSIEEVYDYVVCSGIVEYMRRPLEFLTLASDWGRRMLVSYAPLSETDTKLRRASMGWVNHLSRPQFEHLLDSLGFPWSIVARWDEQIIYMVTRQPDEAVSELTNQKETVR